MYSYTQQNIYGVLLFCPSLIVFCLQLHLGLGVGEGLALVLIKMGYCYKNINVYSAEAQKVASAVWH